MAGSVVDTSFWIKFFVDAGIPSVEATAYAIKFTDNRIQKTMLLDLNKDYLNDMGISCLGDIIAILKHAKAFHDKILRERTLEKIDGPQDAVKIAAVSAATRQVAPSSMPAAAVAALPQQSPAARVQAAAVPNERPVAAAATAAAVVAAAKPSSSVNAAALALAVSRQSSTGVSASARKSAGHSAMHADRVSGVPASAAEEPEAVTDQDDDGDGEWVDARSASAAALPRSHRAVLPPRKRSSTGGEPPVAPVAKKRLGGGESRESVSSSGVAATVSKKPRTASASAKSSASAASASSQTSIFSRLGSSGAGAAAVAGTGPRVTVTGLGKAELLRKPNTPNQVVRLKRPSTGVDAANGTRKSGAFSDDAKAAARILIATARTATASTAACVQAILTGDPEVAAATAEPKKRIGAARTVVSAGQRAAAGSMTADSPLLRQDVKQRLGSAAGDGPSARADGGETRARTVARIGSGRVSTATPAPGEFSAAAANGVGSRQRSSTVLGGGGSGVLGRVGSAAASGGGSSDLGGSASRRRLASSGSSDDLRKRIGSPAASVGGGGGGSSRPRSSVFSRLGGL